MHEPLLARRLDERGNPACIHGQQSVDCHSVIAILRKVLHDTPQFLLLAQWAEPAHVHANKLSNY
jgi:hypothetical protein